MFTVETDSAKKTTEAALRYCAQDCYPSEVMRAKAEIAFIITECDRAYFVVLKNGEIECLDYFLDIQDLVDKRRDEIMAIMEVEKRRSYNWKAQELNYMFL